MDALSRLAFHMQARGEGTGLSRAEAARLKLGQKGQARLTLDEALDLALDATVLEVSEGAGDAAIYAFYHHMLQEYFAARELLRRFRAGRWSARRLRTPWRTWQFAPQRLRPGQRLSPPPVTDWDETAVMAAGLAGRDAARFIAAVRRHNPPLAGRCLAEAGSSRPELQVLAEAVREELRQRQRSPAAHMRARIGAGLALGQLGHPELLPQPFTHDGRTVWAILPPLQPIPAGPFIRGSARGDQHAWPDEYTSERQVTLPAYAIGRYPVTNAEYALFVEDDGYHDERWWSPAGQRWKEGGPDAHAEAIADWLRLRAWLQGQDLEQLGRQFGWPPQRIRFWKEVAQLADDEAAERARQIFARPFDRPGYWDDREQPRPAGGGRQRARGRGLLPLAICGDRPRVPPARRGGVGEGRPRHRRADLPLG